MAEMCFRDVTILHTDQDKEWCQYLHKHFLLDKLGIHTLNVTTLDYKHPPEIEVAIRESHVVVLVATAHMMDYMEAQADWFAKMIREKRNSNLTTVMAALIALSPDECTSVLKGSSYVTDPSEEYKMVDVDVTGANIKQVIEEILEHRDKNYAKRPRKLSLTVTVLPTSINGSGDMVALLFPEEIKGVVTVNFKGIKEEVSTTKVNPYSVTFVVPDVVGEKVGMQVNVDGNRVKRCHLYNRAMGLNTTSVEFMCQSFGVSSKEELDKKLANNFNTSLCGDSKANKIFDEVMSSSLTDCRIASSNKYPTILHWAAANGLSELCSALLSSVSASAAACNIDNCEGRDPAELARVNGHQDLYDLLFDFAETKEIADTWDLYVQCISTKPELASNSSDVYEIMHPKQSSPLTSIQPVKPSKPPLPATPPPAVKKHIEQASTNEDLYIQPVTLSRGAVGSRSQTELIRIQEEVKNGTFSIDDAERLFRSWKERYETGNAVSFKDRQNALQALRSDHNKTLQALKPMQPKKTKKLEHEDSFNADISEPFALRTPNKYHPVGRDSNTSIASSLSTVSRTSTDSGRDSADSRYFSSSDDYEDKRASMRDMYIQLGDYGEVEQLAPPPLPPPRITLERPTTIKVTTGRPAPESSKPLPPPTKPKSFKR
ncbi:B-cell scaffold protein with ankyrin repeats-like isoform X4 [Biomphalaria pfeifferi]|uniref:B-cell scaffold protein with ankyrin repeats-like isoform X4 n=1 Tax=Biomphalaria pfeifferi TaxID=112525 RepID=A0AAD8BBY8_BIOPF|nr:B-cell scaffold protein with ankyrin repeats-like isoform X4 [Biomphalaria pfeifferi]